MPSSFFSLPRTTAVLLALSPTLGFAETTPPPAMSAKAPAAAVAQMAAAAQNLLATLDAAQRAKAVFTLTDDERQNWHFVPLERKGITLADLRPDQDHLVYGLLGSALSADGWRKATTIMSLEKVLFELENSAPKRNTENYYLAIFGEPKAGQAWGWRFEGHHLSLNFSITADAVVSLTPSFMGANPGEFKDGPRAGLRALAAEEDIALELARSLTPDQAKTAIVPGDAPAELLSNQERSVKPFQPVGLAASALNDAQRAQLWKVIAEYVDRFRPDLTTAAKASLEKDGGNITFAWMGSTVTGEGHYYRIQSPQFLFEYDNTQNNARHPHAVWRDFNGDFGADILKEHYNQNHTPK
ncbi:MAG: hypothetical protein JWL81_1159 [Verrucomicrobiales bacterium]|nr:hypothetical protein [Verrucomicrobiales bacterium]